MSDNQRLHESSESESPSSPSESSFSSEEEVSAVPVNINETEENNFISNVASTSGCNPKKIIKFSNKVLSVWPVEDLLELVNRMKDTLPENDSTKFSIRAKTIAWDNIAFNGHSAKDCSSMWSTIQKRIRKNRILQEILCDAEQAIRSMPKTLNKKQKNRHPELPKRPLTAYMLYCADNREKVCRENPSIKNVDVVKLMAKNYNSLSEDDKNVYVKREEDLKKIYKKNLNDFNIKYPKALKQKTVLHVNRPQTPFQIFCENQDKANAGSTELESVLKKQYREKWNTMENEEKIEFINSAIDNERKFNSERPDKPKYKSILTKDEQLLRDKLLGKPKKPPHSAYGLFTQIELKKDEMSKLDIKDRMKIVGTRWANCPQETKDRYISETKVLKEKYKSEYDNYLKSLSQEEQQVELKSRKRKLGVKDNEIVKRRKVEVSEKNYLEKPKIPPSAPELFAQMNPNKNINLDEAWTNLDDKEKIKYKRKVSRMHTKYLAEFDVYVKSTMGMKDIKNVADSSSSSDNTEKSLPSTEESKSNVKFYNENETEDSDSESESEDDSANSSSSDESESDDDEISSDSD